MRIFLFFVLSISMYSCTTNTEIQRIANLSAFAHTYGLIRWFYPSDETQEIDWNQFALYGSSQVAGCRSASDLRKKLEALFLPIAPGIFFSEQDTTSNYSSITPPDTSEMYVVTWQHFGVDLGLWSNVYVSKRINRPLQTRNISKAAMYHFFPASDYNGCELKIKALIKKTTLSDDFKIFLRITDEDDAYLTLCADTTLKPLINFGKWEEYEFVLSVGKNNTNPDVYWGIYTEGEGSFCVDKIVLEDVTNGKIITTPLLNMSFFTNHTVYSYTYVEKGVCIQTKNLLFEEHANFGDYKSQKLTEGLYVHVPLALYGTKDQTYPESNRNALSKLKSQMTKSVASVPNNIYMCADVVVTWNVIKYFSPYLAELQINWDKELENTLSLTSSRHKFYNVRPLQLMMAKLEDAHVYISELDEIDKYLPLRVKKIGRQIVVVNAIDPSFKNGDVILKINDSNALKDYENFEDIISGGKHFKAAQAAYEWWAYYSKISDTITMDVLRNNEKLIIKTSSVTPSQYSKLLNPMHYKKPKNKPSGWLNNDVLYINLLSSEYDEIKKLINERKPNQTVIIDIRNGSRFLFRHVVSLLNPDIDTYKDRAGISIIPRIVYPETPVIEDTLSTLPLKSPNIKNIFLIGSFNISNNEEMLDFVRYAGLGYFVGTNTGGCNGRINIIYLPSGREVRFTGNKIMSNIGSEYYYYRKGIDPDVYVEETIDDIKNGSDAIFEKALEIAEKLSQK